MTLISLFRKRFEMEIGTEIILTIRINMADYYTRVCNVPYRQFISVSEAKYEDERKL